MQDENYLMGRQPILNRNDEVVTAQVKAYGWRGGVC